MCKLHLEHRSISWFTVAVVALGLQSLMSGGVEIPYTPKKLPPAAHAEYDINVPAGDFPVAQGVAQAAAKTNPDATVYLVKCERSTREDALEIAQQHFGFTGDVQEQPGGFFLIRSGFDQLEVYRADKSFIVYEHYVREDPGRPRPAREEIPSDAQCVEIAKTFLREKQFLPPEGEYFLSSIDDNTSGGSGAVFVSFGRLVDGMKARCVGTLPVHIGRGGQVVFMKSHWPKLQAFGRYPVISPDGAVAGLRAGKALAPYGQLDQGATGIELVYYVPPDFGEPPARTWYLRPVYEFQKPNRIGGVIASGWVDAVQPEWVEGAP